MKANLVLDWCSRKAAQWAVEQWHYSRAMPIGKLVTIGVWEDGAFVGVVVFGRGSSRKTGAPFGLRNTEVCELVRVALRAHRTPVTRMVRVALSMLARQSPGLRAVVSFADTGQGHLGSIYMAGNWTYLGEAGAPAIRVLGRTCRTRTVGARYGTHSVKWLREHVDPEACYLETPRKHKYAFPLDRAMRAQLAKMAQPYPKRPLDTEAPAPTGDRRWKPDPAAPEDKALVGALVG